MAGDSRSPDSGDQLFVIVAVLIIGALFWMVTRNAWGRLVIDTSYYETLAATRIPVFGREWRSLLAAIPQIDPRRMTIWDMIRLLGDAGSAWRFPFALLALAVAAQTWSGAVSRRFRRQLNFDRMLEIQAENFPVIRPAVMSRLTNVPQEAGPWRRAYLPYEWALRNGALEPPADYAGEAPYDFEALLSFYQGKARERPVAGGLPRINERRARRAFIAEMTPWRGLGRMRPSRRALIAALAMWINGDFLDETYATAGGNRLLAHYNRTYRHFEMEGPRFLVWLATSLPPLRSFLVRMKLVREIVSPSIDTGDADDVLQAPEIRRTIARFVRKHAFEEGVFMAMLDACNDLMLLPTQNFLWCKPIDRTLFYALDSLGRNGGWSESGGTVAHYRSEIFNEQRIVKPQVDMAVDALVRELVEHSWLTDDPV